MVHGEPPAPGFGRRRPADGAEQGETRRGAYATPTKAQYTSSSFGERLTGRPASYRPSGFEAGRRPLGGSRHTPKAEIDATVIGCSIKLTGVSKADDSHARARRRCSYFTLQGRSRELRLWLAVVCWPLTVASSTFSSVSTSAVRNGEWIPILEGDLQKRVVLWLTTSNEFG